MQADLHRHRQRGRRGRPGLQQALDYVREGDVLVVWRLDRLGRLLKHLIELIMEGQLIAAGQNLGRLLSATN